jgi:polyketide cyclase/dehydrase/lipid transport protein
VISASGVIASSCDELYAFLSDLENHWLIADRFIEVLSLNGESDGRTPGGRVRMHGPFGTRRTATTSVVSMEPSQSLEGIAQLSGGTRALVRWSLTQKDPGTRVVLSAHLERTGPLDALLLAAGGSLWVRRRFAAILATLERRFALGTVRSFHPAEC